MHNGQWLGDKVGEPGTHIEALRFPPTATSCACVGLSGDGILSSSRSFTSRTFTSRGKDRDLVAQSLAICPALQGSLTVLLCAALYAIKAAQARFNPPFKRLCREDGTHTAVEKVLGNVKT